MLRESKLTHVFLMCQDIHRLANYYKDVLGFKVQFQEHGQHLWLTTGETSLVIQKEQDPTPLKEQNNVLTWFKIDRNIESLYEQLKVRGVELLGPIVEGPSRKLIHLVDPEGHRLGFYQSDEK
jgi:catechol-2,3-dioxygenase